MDSFLRYRRPIDTAGAVGGFLGVRPCELHAFADLVAEQPALERERSLFDVFVLGFYMGERLLVADASECSGVAELSGADREHVVQFIERLPQIVWASDPTAALRARPVVFWFGPFY